MPSSARRSAILESAVAEFAALGFYGARIERVAAAAGANKQLIFHYFESKAGLYEAVVGRIFGAQPPSVPEGATPLESLKRHVEWMGGWLDENPGAAPVLNECVRPGEGGIPDGAHLVVRDWVERERGVLRGILEAGQMQGFFRDDFDSEAVVDIVVGSLVGRQALPYGGREATSPAAGTAVILARMVADYCAWR